MAIAAGIAIPILPPLLDATVFPLLAWFPSSLFSVVTGNAITSDSTGSPVLGTRHYQNAPALNDEISVQVWLRAGNYTLTLIGTTDSICAISTVYIDAVSQGTIDWYGAVASYNVSKTIAVTCSQNGLHTLKLKAATKNALSTNYYQITSLGHFK